MNVVDLSAQIIPGKSAAGFELGQNLADVKASIHNLSEWKREVMSLPDAIASVSEWLAVSVSQISNGQRSGDIFYYGRGSVELHFNSEGVLHDISVFNGYSGVLFGKLKIGDKLSSIREYCNVFYDEGDEMHYPAEDSLIKGFALYAEELSLEDSPEQLITGISIHDWSLASK